MPGHLNFQQTGWRWDPRQAQFARVPLTLAIEEIV
jgi:hypothetical protein